MLRKNKRHLEAGAGGRPSSDEREHRDKNKEYHLSHVPKVYYKDGGNYKRENIKDYDYKGNF